jgi:hypothetical protein
MRKYALPILLATLLAALAVTAQSSQKTAAASITIEHYGFDPGAIGLPAGNVILAVRNHSGVPQVTLQLKDSTGKSVHDFPVQNGRLVWQESISLSAGAYTLTEAGHSGWICKVSVK